jgi:hypothetical protein
VQRLRRRATNPRTIARVHEAELPALVGEVIDALLATPREP